MESSAVRSVEQNLFLLVWGFFLLVCSRGWVFLALNPLKHCAQAPSFGMPPFRSSDKIQVDLKHIRTSFLEAVVA